MTMWSGFGSRASSAIIAGAKSSATVQQMQPLASSMIASRGQAASAQPLRRSPSTPTSPNSLMMSASRRPPACASRWRISVVLPAPRKPVTMVTGVLASMRGPFRGAKLREHERRRARDDALAEGERPLAPGNDSVGRGGVEARGGHDILDMLFARRDRRRHRSIFPARRARLCKAACRRKGTRRHERDVGLRRETLAERGEQRRAQRPLSDLQVTQTSRVAAGALPACRRARSGDRERGRG